MSARPQLLMIRHTRVCQSLKGVCYGASDVALSDAAEAEIADVCSALERDVPPGAQLTVVHSGLSRAGKLAHAIARTFSAAEPTIEPRIREMNFGEWELQSWQSIFLKVGHKMSDMIHKPETYAPPGGETAHAVRDRALEWYHEQTDMAQEGTVTVAVSHGGPIAALRGTKLGRGAADWPKLIPSYGQIIDMSLSQFD